MRKLGLTIHSFCAGACAMGSLSLAVNEQWTACAFGILFSAGNMAIHVLALKDHEL